ncbi:hypothetical protein V7S43_016028 [Phytophthora oleae]|uniref:Carrier domain-containing protein n=1 Tax=Phytophthora oleae TaxID=2107226 RepID=A0ABD3F0N2_9STRA
MALCQCLEKFWDERRENEDLAFVQRGFTVKETEEVTCRQVYDWIQALRDALAVQDGDWEAVGINLTPFSIEETASMLLVAQQKRWIYVPIDVELPVARQLESLGNAGIRSLVTSVNSPLANVCMKRIKRVEVKTMELKASPFRPVQVITFIDGGESELERTCLRLEAVKKREELVAPLYVLFTSGTTEKPRGALGTRIGAWTRLNWMWKTYPFAVDTKGLTSERVVRATKLSFVDSVWEILGAFLKKVPLVHVQLPKNESDSDSYWMKSVVLEDSARFLDIVHREKVTRFTAVPSVLELLLLQTTATGRQSAFSGLRYVLSSGEMLPIYVVQEFTTDLPHVTFLNLYGSTEVSGDVTCMEVKEPLSSAQIVEWEHTGIPISNLDQHGVVGAETSLLLLSDAAPKVIWPRKDVNQAEKEVIRGVLYVSGPLVTLGYVANDRKDMFKTSDELGSDQNAMQFRMWLCTGDICTVVHGCLYFCGRKDNAVKIRGQLVYLEAVERAVAAALKETVEDQQLNSSQVLAFTETKGAFQQQCIVVCIISGDVSPSVTRYSNTRMLNAWIAEHYGTSHIPHEMLRVDTTVVPRFINGKIDRRGLKQFLIDYDANTSVSLKCSSIDGEASSSTEKLVAQLLKKILDLPLSCSIHSQTFNEVGGNSLLVTLFLHELRQVFGTLPLTNQELLGMTIEEVILVLESLPKRHSREDPTKVPTELPNVVFEGNNELKRRRKTHLAPPVSVKQGSLAFLSRYNQSSDVNGFHLPTCYTSPTSSGSSFSLGLRSVWNVDLDKCIDASPLVVQRRDHEGRVCSTWAVVGSHSAQLVCIDVQTGREVWRVTLDDRIEACAALSVKHQLVYVGTYAGTFFALNLQSGEVSWRFQAQGTIKTSALVLDTHGLVVVGAYDNKLYGLDVATGHKQWTVDLQGSIFSTPLYCAWSKQLLAASTNGNVVAFVSASNGVEFTGIQEQWRLQLPAPVFAGLNADPLSNILLVGCADGNLYGVKLSSGEIQWQIPTEKPIFSSPCVYGTGSVVFGSHDGKLRKVDTCTGELQWATNLNGAVFASPTVVRLVAEPLNGGDSKLVCCVTTTSGWLCFCDEKTGVIVYQTGDSSGKTMDSIKNNGNLGPLFGSPVLIDNWCLLGTRTNHFYGLKLTS